MEVSNIQLLRRGYLFCSETCVCEMCLRADEWFLLLLDYGLRMFRGGTGEIPPPAEFRVCGAEEAA